MKVYFEMEIKSDFLVRQSLPQSSLKPRYDEQNINYCKHLSLPPPSSISLLVAEVVNSDWNFFIAMTDTIYKIFHFVVFVSLLLLLLLLYCSISRAWCLAVRRAWVPCGVSDWNKIYNLIFPANNVPPGELCDGVGWLLSAVCPHLSSSWQNSRPGTV